MRSKSLPNYLRTYRKRSSLSQEELAFLLGSKCGARISRYERCKQTPNLRTLLSYELLFGTPVRGLYGGVANEVRHDLRKRAKILIRRLTRCGLGYLTSRKLETLRSFIEEEAEYKTA